MRLGAKQAARAATSVIKIFMDESGTHDGSPYVTVAAYAGKPKHWAAFSTEWTAKKKPDDIGVYHAADCANQHGEFKDWQKQRSTEFAAKMLPIIAAHPPIGVVIGIEMAAFNRAMAPHPSLRKMVGTPYGCCFQWVVQTIMDKLEEHGSNERIGFFHERNDYQAEATKSFDFVANQRKRHRGEMTLTFGGKQDYVPLQAADILAYEGSKLMQCLDAGRPKRKAIIALDPEEKRLVIKRYGMKNIGFLIDRLKTVEEEVRVFGHPITLFRDDASGSGGAATK
jgi:hypothetical protein